MSKELQQIAGEAVRDAGEWKLKCRDLAREVDRLTKERDSQQRVCIQVMQELAALKSQSCGVVLPEWLASSRAFVDRLYAAGWRDHADAQHAGAAGMYDELIARLNQPASACDERVREALRECLEVMELHRIAGQVYSNGRAALSANHSEQVRHMVPSWMASARTFVDRLHLAGWRDHADAQHAGVAGMYDELIAAAPSAGSQREQE